MYKIPHQGKHNPDSTIDVPSEIIKIKPTEMMVIIIIFMLKTCTTMCKYFLLD